MPTLPKIFSDPVTQNTLIFLFGLGEPSDVQIVILKILINGPLILLLLSSEYFSCFCCHLLTFCFKFFVNNILPGTL